MHKKNVLTNKYELFLKIITKIKYFFNKKYYDTYNNVCVDYGNNTNSNSNTTTNSSSSLNILNYLNAT